MRATWSEPYLWVHLAGLAAVPIFLELCLLGLAASAVRLPAQLVLLLVAAAGIIPIAWMQLQRPFSIFSLLFLAVKPRELNEAQRQILRRFMAPIGKVVTVLTAGVAAVLLWQLSDWILLVNPTKVALVPGGALGGLLLAMSAFLLANLFLQVPASVLTVMLTPDVLVRNATPYPIEKVAQDFTLIGIPVKQILPRMTTDSTVPAPVDRPIAPPSTQPQTNSWDEALSFEADETTGSIEAVSIADASNMTADEPASPTHSLTLDSETADSEDNADEITVDWVDVAEAESGTESGAESGAEENHGIATVEADSVATEVMPAEVTPADLISTDAAETESSEPELTEAAPDSVAPSLTEADFAQPVLDSADQAEIDLPVSESIEADSMTANSVIEHSALTSPLVAASSVMEVEQSLENRQTLGIEAIADTIPDATPEVETVSVPQDGAIKIEILAPNAADTVVSIVLNHETPVLEVPAESASDMLAPARTASEIVVMIIPS